MSVESHPLPQNNTLASKKVEEPSLLDKLSRAQELISDTISIEGENDQTRNSRIEDAKSAFLTEVPNISELVYKLDAIGEKEVAIQLKSLFKL